MKKSDHPSPQRTVCCRVFLGSAHSLNSSLHPQKVRESEEEGGCEPFTPPRVAVSEAEANHNVK